MNPEAIPAQRAQPTVSPINRDANMTVKKGTVNIKLVALASGMFAKA